MISQAFSKVGDTLADSKIVLPWLLGIVGAPLFFVGLLVPLREALALLPQIFGGDWIRQFPRRKNFWSLGSLVQGGCILAMASVALAGITGEAAGWLIIALLVVFSLARGIASIASKDVLGKTVSKGRRGRVSGYAGMLGGFAAGATGLLFLLTGEDAPQDWALALLALAGCMWLLGGVVFQMLPEQPGATEGGRSLRQMLREQIGLLRENRPFRRFLVTRGLLVATAFYRPIYVTMAQQRDGQGIAALGWMILASGLAASLSSMVWGRLADRSSRAVMALGGGLAALLAVVVMAIVVLAPEFMTRIWFFGAVIFLLGVAHAGVRIGRKTHMVDLADGKGRTDMVATGNTITGVVLVVAGSAVGLLLQVGILPTLVLLTLATLTGVWMSMRLNNSQTG